MSTRSATRIVFALAAAGVLASCSAEGPTLNFKKSKEYFSEREYGRASPRVVHHNGPVPKGGGHAVVGDAYQVAGKTYVPQANPEGYSATGLASWYGSAFHGRLTANGEVYDVAGLTAAHPTLPLPSYARVTNLENGSSILVRVNDRGPFAEGRLIDVSEHVADLLGFHQSGTAHVRVDYVGPARMDGLDDKMLMASYRGGAPASDSGTRFAFNAPKKQTPPAVAPVVLASATSAPRLRPVVAPVALTPDAVYRNDLLGTLIMQSGGFTSSYASTPPETAAQRAVTALADSAPANTSTTESFALRSGRAVVRLGTFADVASAARATDPFVRFGLVDASKVVSDGRTEIVVDVQLDPTADADVVIAAAKNQGLRDAHRVE